MDPEVNYDHLIQAMDAIRSTEVPATGGEPQLTKVALFPKIAVGDAP
jgi:hypothetical protein